LYLTIIEGKTVHLSNKVLSWRFAKGYEICGGYKGEEWTLDAGRSDAKASVC